MSLLINILLIATLILSLMTVVVFLRKGARPVERLDTWMSSYTVPEDEVKPEKVGLLQAIGAQAEKTGLGKNYVDRSHLKLMQADIPLTGYEFTIIKAFISVIVGLLAALTLKSLLAGVIGAVLIWILAGAYVEGTKANRLKMFNSQLGDALTLLSNSLRAGFSFMQAISSVAREMPDPLSKEFTKLLKEMSLGLSMEKALANLLLRVPLDDLELLVMAILIQKEIGGNLAEIIDNIASTIRERITIQLEIKTLVAQGKMSGVIIGLLPIFLTAVLFALNPSYMSLLYTTTVGKILVALGMVSMLIGAGIIRKIVRIEV